MILFMASHICGSNFDPHPTFLHYWTIKYLWFEFMVRFLYKWWNL